MYIEILGTALLMGTLPLECDSAVNQEEGLGCETSRQNGIDPSDWSVTEKVAGILLSTLAAAGEQGRDPIWTDNGCTIGAGMAQFSHNMDKDIRENDASGNKDFGDNSVGQSDIDESEEDEDEHDEDEDEDYEDEDEDENDEDKDNEDENDEGWDD